MALGVALLAGVLASVAAAWALEEQRGEDAAIKACDKRLCTILVQKSPKGDDLKCALTKTWARSKIKEADISKLSWGFGDARCSVDIDISRAELVEVMTGERASFRVPRHTANCVVEQDGKLEKVTAVLAPKIEFKNGRADKIWVNLKSVEGPTSIKLTLQAAAQLADTFGLFHKQMLKSINKYIERHCPATQSMAATEPPPKGKAAK
jgi:hypothetical protein